MTPTLIALDWGTSSLRAYLLGAGGVVLEERSEPLGIMKVVDRNFAGTYDAVTRDWRERWPNLNALASGMIGSAQGWVEASYARLPAGIDDIAHALVPVPGTSLHIVPGLMQTGDAANVMRGEETQIFGALKFAPELAARGELVLPGTHSKWVSLAKGKVARFETYMTGELFAVLRDHSILGAFARKGETAQPRDAENAFLRGVDAVRNGNGRADQLLFSARALVLAGELDPACSLDYLSGLLIGAELASALEERRAAPVLVGDKALCARYRLAFSRFGLDEVGEIEGAAVAGLWAIALAAGLVNQ
jgi:2-dehydro-3-deoxygalactonokinase